MSDILCPGCRPRPSPPAFVRTFRTHVRPSDLAQPIRHGVPAPFSLSFPPSTGHLAGRSFIRPKAASATIGSDPSTATHLVRLIQAAILSVDPWSLRSNRLPPPPLFGTAKVYARRRTDNKIVERHLSPVGDTHENLCRRPV